MKIIICGSITAAEEMERIRDALVNKGHTVEIPEGVKNPRARERTEVSISEKASDKIEGDLIRGYFEKMKGCDVALIVNPEKRGVPGYIGGNALIEMAFAYVLGLKTYVLYQLPDLSYTSEILAMQPVVIDGNLDKISES